LYHPDCTKTPIRLARHNHLFGASSMIGRTVHPDVPNGGSARLEREGSGHDL